MSAAVIIMMVGLLAVPWTVAGLIHPPAVWMKGATRRKILFCGVVALFVLLAIATLLSGPPPAEGQKFSDGEASLSAFWLLAFIAWPFIALVARANSKAPALPPKSAAMPLTAPEPAREVVTQVAGPGKHKAKPVNATRAIRTGWSQGEIAFTYEDADGEVTYRTVTVHAVTATYIKGECHDRQAERTFRLDRVIGYITDTQTGETLPPKRWASALRR